MNMFVAVLHQCAQGTRKCQSNGLNMYTDGGSAVVTDGLVIFA